MIRCIIYLKRERDKAKGFIFVTMTTQRFEFGNFYFNLSQACWQNAPDDLDKASLFSPLADEINCEFMIDGDICSHFAKDVSPMYEGIHIIPKFCAFFLTFTLFSMYEVQRQMHIYWTMGS